MKPEWMTERGGIKERSFCMEFLENRPLWYHAGQFYDLQGVVSDDTLRQEICYLISGYTETDIARKVDVLFRALRLYAYQEPLPMKDTKIYVRNGTYLIGDGLYEEEGFCPSRLNVWYNRYAPKPEKWLAFLQDLLEPQDIDTLQEYLGYCLIPCTKAQKMLMILGSGGEGKSQIGFVMKELFGSAMTTCSIQKVEQNRFSRADLEGKLLMVDDDMDFSALKKTNYIKSIITAEEPMDVEKKGVQSYQAKLYARFLCFGNGALTSLYDRSDGFFRRQIILTARPISRDRVTDPFLKSRLVKEKEGIFLWMIEGLERLICSDFVFTLSDKAKANMQNQIAQGNNLIPFLESEGYLRFGSSYSATTKGLYEAYRRWCEDNAETALSIASFATQLAAQAPGRGLRHSNHIPLPGDRSCRGYLGVEVL